MRTRVGTADARLQLSVRPCGPGMHPHRSGNRAAGAQADRASGMADTPRQCLSVNETSHSVRHMAVNGVGRPSKGVRDQIMAKPAAPFGMILRENAAKLGYSYGDYLVALAAKALDMPQFAPDPPRDRAEQLQFPKEGDKTAA